MRAAIEPNGKRYVQRPQGVAYTQRGYVAF